MVDFGEFYGSTSFGENIVAKKCYKVLTFEGKYKQERRPQTQSYALVMSDLKFVWECRCLSEEELRDVREGVQTDLVPLPPTTGPTAQPAGENYWQQREFTYVMEVKSTDKECEKAPTRRDRMPFQCEGKIECELPDRSRPLPGVCETKPCLDRHIPASWGTLFGRCSCAAFIREIANDMRRNNTCGESFNDGSALKCE